MRVHGALACLRVNSSTGREHARYPGQGGCRMLPAACRITTCALTKKADVSTLSHYFSRLDYRDLVRNTAMYVQEYIRSLSFYSFVHSQQRSSIERRTRSHSHPK